MTNSSHVVFNNGLEMPLIGFGTWQSTPDEVKTAVHAALDAGYRHIDTAYMYQNEAAIGEVLDDWIRSGKLKREQLFLVTKLPLIGNRPEKVEHFLQLSLNSLKTDYVDLYLIHFPAGFKGANDLDLYPTDENGLSVLDLETDLPALWKAMEAQVDCGRAKSIGISNFNSQQIERICASARIPPANLQVELHAYFQQKPLRAVCAKHQITVCAYGPLGSKGRIELNAKRGMAPPPVPGVLEDPVVVEMARAHGKTPAQVLLKHLMQQQVVVIPKSVNAKRIQENFNVFDFTLSEQEIEQLNGLDKGQGHRTFLFDFFPGLPNHPEFPFNIPY